MWPWDDWNNSVDAKRNSEVIQVALSITLWHVLIGSHRVGAKERLLGCHSTQTRSTLASPCSPPHIGKLNPGKTPKVYHKFQIDEKETDPAVGPDHDQVTSHVSWPGSFAMAPAWLMAKCFKHVQTPTQKPDPQPPLQGKIKLCINCSQRTVPHHHHPRWWTLQGMQAPLACLQLSSVHQTQPMPTHSKISKNKKCQVKHPSQGTHQLGQIGMLIHQSLHRHPSHLVLKQLHHVLS